MASYEAAFRRHVQQHGPLPVPPPPKSVKLETTTQEQVVHSPTPPSEVSVSGGFSIWQAILSALVFGLIAHAYRRASRPSSLCFPVEDLLNSTRETNSIYVMLVAQSDKNVNCFPHGTLPSLLDFKDAGLKAAHSIGALTPQSFGLRDPTDSQLTAKLAGVLTKLHNARDIARDMELDLEAKRTAVQKSLENNAVVAQQALKGGSVGQEDTARYSAEFKVNKECFSLSGSVLSVITSGVRVLERQISRLIAFESCLKHPELGEPIVGQRARHCLTQVFGLDTCSTR